MSSDLDFVNPPVLPANGSSSQSVTACWFVPSALFLTFQVETVDKKRRGLPASKGIMSSVSGILECRSVTAGFQRPPRTEFPPPAWVLGPTLTGTDPIPMCSWFPCGLLPLQAPGFQPSPLHPTGRAKLPFSSPPQCSQWPFPELSSSSASPWALQLLCLSPVQRIRAGCHGVHCNTGAMQTRSGGLFVL